MISSSVPSQTTGVAVSVKSTLEDHVQRRLDGDKEQIRFEDKNGPVNKETFGFEHKTSDKPERVKHGQYTLAKRPWRRHVTDFEAIVSEEYPGNGSESDPFLVQWLNDDPENPKTYSTLMMWSITMLVGMMTLCVSLASSAYTGAIGPMLKQFHSSDEVLLLGLSVMVLGFAVGPLLWGPLSETIGRRNVLLVALTCYTLWTSACSAAQNVWTLIILRFFCGTFGSSAFVIPGGQIADMFSAERRGVAVAVFSAAPFLGPTLGPLVGGLLSDAAGWRWVMGLLGIYAAVLTVLGFIFLPETYAPVLLRERARLLSKVTGKLYLTAMDAKRSTTAKDRVRQALVRPWALLLREPIVLILSIYMAVVYGILYLCFAAFPIVFQEGRGWNAGKGGLAFMGILVGFLIGVIIIVFDNSRYIRLHQATGGFAPPESRLPPAIGGGLAIIIGLAWFASTNSPSVHWAIPIAAGLPFGMGFILVFMCCTNYLIDAYVIYAASVMAANSIIRSLFGAIFPLFTTYMYRDLGIHWASAVPGFVALACFPFPILFYFKGAKIRLHCKYAMEAALFLESLKSNLERQSSQAAETEVAIDPDNAG